MTSSKDRAVNTKSFTIPEQALEYVTGTTFEQFEQKIEGKPVVILYPRHRKRGALVAMFLRYYQQHTLYYSLDEDQASLRTWLDRLMYDQDLAPLFGTQTLAALSEDAAPEELAEAFGADLGGALDGKPFMLFLDMFDHLVMDEDASRFFMALPEALPDHVQIVVNARLLALRPWNDLILTGQAAVIGNESAMSGGIYGHDPALGQLEIYALAGGHVYIDGRPVTRWEGSLPKHLFYYFVDHPMVTRDEIFSIFWPKLGVKEATNVFHVTKRKISERLGHELTQYGNGFYTHSPRLMIHYDVQLFEDAARQALNSDVDAPALWYTAVSLYRSDFLPKLDLPWVRERRAALRQQYAQVLINLGRYHRGNDDLEQALGYLLRALRVKPDWEDVHQDVMLLYHQMGRKDDAIAQYRQLEKTLKRMFNIPPSKDTQRLFQIISAT